MVRHSAVVAPHRPASGRDLLFIQGGVGRTTLLASVPWQLALQQKRVIVVDLDLEALGIGALLGATAQRGVVDALMGIVPRSILRLLKASTTHAQQHPRGKGPLILPEDLMRGLIETSIGRVTELGDEYKVVTRLENLAGQTMLMDRADVIALLARPTSTRDRFGTDGEAIFDELRRTGVLERRPGRVDVPDIYRYGYGIKRKGGARMPR